MKSRIHKFDVRQYMTDPCYEIFRYRDLYLKKVALHSHDFYEIYLFQSGDVQYSIEGRNYLLEPGDLLLISPLELHQPMITCDDRAYSRYVLWIAQGFLDSLSTDRTDLSRCFDVDAPGHTNLLRLDEADRRVVINQMDCLARERDSAQYGSDLLGFSMLTQLLVMVNRLAQKAPQHHELEDKSGAAVGEVLAYINAHYNEDLSLDSLAQKFYISKYYLSHEFSRLVGTSVYRYIIKKRLVIAKKFLSEGMSPVDVCRLCGFGDYTNFYRSFRAEYQVSPKEYLSSARQMAAQQEGQATE